MEALLQGCDLRGVHRQVWALRQAHSPYRGLLTLAPARSFPPKSRTDCAERLGGAAAVADNCPEEGKVRTFVGGDVRAGGWLVSGS